MSGPGTPTDAPRVLAIGGYELWFLAHDRVVELLADGSCRS